MTACRVCGCDVGKGVLVCGECFCKYDTSLKYVRTVQLHLNNSEGRGGPIYGG